MALRPTLRRALCTTRTTPTTLSTAWETARADSACAAHIAAYGTCVRAHGIEGEGGGGGIDQGACATEYDRMHDCFMAAYKAATRGGK